MYSCAKKKTIVSNKKANDFCIIKGCPHLRRKIKGRWAGKTKEDFFKEEQEALRPKAEVNLFTYVIEREEKTT